MINSCLDPKDENCNYCFRSSMPQLNVFSRGKRSEDEIPVLMIVVVIYVQTNLWYFQPYRINIKYIWIPQILSLLHPYHISLVLMFGHEKRHSQIKENLQTYPFCYFLLFVIVTGVGFFCNKLPFKGKTCQGSPTLVHQRQPFNTPPLEDKQVSPGIKILFRQNVC